jgi:hypothetical protein
MHVFKKGINLTTARVIRPRPVKSLDILEYINLGSVWTIRLSGASLIGRIAKT